MDISDYQGSEIDKQVCARPTTGGGGGIVWVLGGGGCGRGLGSTWARPLEGRKTRHHGLGRCCPVSQQISYMYRYPRSNQLSSAQINSTQLA
jgi:hypothetical protein